MLPLEPPNSHHLSYADGWLGLGNWREANEALERIEAGLRAHPDVLQVRWQIYAKAEKWEPCVDIGNALVRIVPDCSFGWIHRSFALHELKRTQEAFDQLLPALDAFPKLWVIPYNLACYSAQLGLLDECQTWFKKAMAIDGDAAKREAIDDPDLKPLWDSMSGTLWKRAV